MSGPAQGIVLSPAPQANAPEPSPNNDGTPTKGYAKLVDNGDGKLKGTSGNDRISISDLVKDNDQVINAGAGDDIFNFNGSESRLPNNIDRVNGIVKFGEGNDTVFLGFQQTDYTFSLRADGGIKIHYTGDNHDIDGAAVTFYDAEFFTFRNVSDTTGENFATYTLTHDQLVAQINAGTLV